MFNFQPPTVPGFRVGLADEVPGFRVNEDGSIGPSAVATDISPFGYGPLRPFALLGSNPYLRPNSGTVVRERPPLFRSAAGGDR